MGVFKVDRSVVLVDAGYLYAAGGLLCHGESARGLLRLDAESMIKWLRDIALGHSGIQLLRTYWYGGARNGTPTPEQLAVSEIAGLKLRLGRISSAGQQKGVDALIYRDLITLATERAIADAYILSGDEDLREGVEAAQDRGVRVTLIGIPAKSGHNQSWELCREVDDRIELDQATLSQYLTRPGSNNAKPTPSPQTIAREFTRDWQSGSTKDEVEAVMKARPKIPRSLDVGLLTFACKELDTATLDEATKRALRLEFWKSVAQAAS